MQKEEKMLEFKLVKPDSPELPAVSTLYERAFPANERRPLMPLVVGLKGRSEVISLWENDTYCGFMVLLTYRDIVHIIYFATEENLRGKGIGTAALKKLQEVKKGYRIIADLEKEYDGADNNEQRRLRREFYLRNGYIVSPVRYDWQGDPYEILVQGGNITDEEFWEFWDSFS